MPAKGRQNQRVFTQPPALAVIQRSPPLGSMVTLCPNSLGITRRWCGMDGDAKIFINSDGRVMKPHRAIRAFIHVLEHQRIGTIAYLLHSTLERDLSIVQNDNMIGNLKGLFKFMRYKNTGQSHGVIELSLIHISEPTR